MYHATINGHKKVDVEWDGLSKEGKANGVAFTPDINTISKDKSNWIYNDKSYNVEIVQINSEAKEVSVKVNGTMYQVQLKDRFDDLLKSLGMESAGVKKHRDVKAPMPGLVLDILVQEGQTVEKDTPLIILEAMKMENVIKSPAVGTIKKVSATKGTAVEKNSVLIEFM